MKMLHSQVSHSYELYFQKYILSQECKRNNSWPKSACEWEVFRLETSIRPTPYPAAELIQRKSNGYYTVQLSRVLVPLKSSLYCSNPRILAQFPNVCNVV